MIVGCAPRSRPAAARCPAHATAPVEALSEQLTSGLALLAAVVALVAAIWWMARVPAF
ncbi:MAG TPA: hypothetical protein VK066_20370 [Chloroflexota bacterium]|nr:hypothetical protein [Chloroflexota bacterium]